MMLLPFYWQCNAFYIWIETILVWDTVTFKWVGFSFSGESKFINEESLKKLLKWKKVIPFLSFVLIFNLEWSSITFCLWRAYHDAQDLWVWITLGYKFFCKKNSEWRGKAPAAATARPHCFSWNEKSINCMFRQRFGPNALLVTADCTLIPWLATWSSSLFLSLVGFCFCLSVCLFVFCLFVFLFICMSVLSLSDHKCKPQCSLTKGKAGNSNYFLTSSEKVKDLSSGASTHV